MTEIGVPPANRFGEVVALEHSGDGRTAVILQHVVLYPIVPEHSRVVGGSPVVGSSTRCANKNSRSNVAASRSLPPSKRPARHGSGPTGRHLRGEVTEMSLRLWGRALESRSTARSTTA